jgi:uncharacterized membrane protein YccC
LPRLRFPRLDVQPANLIYSFNNFAAVTLALYISFLNDLDRPYWAVLTVYLTAQPLAGALRRRVHYRVIGTVLGAAAAVALVPNLVDQPLLLSTGLAGWVGLCLFLSLLDRTPRSYIFLVAGFTAVLVGFPTVDTPDAIFDTAVARVEETIIGILCATLFHSIFFPREVTTALNARVAKFMSDLRDFASATILGLDDPQRLPKRGRLAADVTQLHILAGHLPFDTATLRPRQDAVQALRDQLALLLPWIAAVEDRLNALRELHALPRELDALVRDVAAYLRDPQSTREDADALRARSLASPPPLDFAERETVWPRMLATSAAVRLAELIETWRDSLTLAAFVRDPGTAPPRIDALLRQGGRRPLHRDYTLAALSGWAVMAAVLGCCAIWIFTVWPSGGVAAMFAGVFASLFATFDDPAAALSNFLFWVIVAVPIAAFYLFAVLPAIDGFTMLVIAVSPFYLLVGYLQADPVQVRRGIPLCLGVTGTLAVEPSYQADFADFANVSLGLIIGVAAALWSTQLFRSVGHAWNARRILRRGREDLSDLAAGRGHYDRNIWISLMLDRMGLIIPHLQIAAASKDLAAADPRVDLRAGLSVITLRETGWRPPEVDIMLARLSETFAARSRDPSVQFGPQLLEAIDNVITAFGRAGTLPAGARICAALVGVRRTLYPTAPGYR